MGITMHIKDTYEVTMEELMSMLPNSKATKQVNQLMAKLELFKNEAVQLAMDALKLQKDVEKLKMFVEFIHENWDCDSDSHKYNQPCRCCEAKALLEELT